MSKNIPRISSPQPFRYFLHNRISGSLKVEWEEGVEITRIDLLSLSCMRTHNESDLINPKTAPHIDDITINHYYY